MFASKLLIVIEMKPQRPNLTIASGNWHRSTWEYKYNIFCHGQRFCQAFVQLWCINGKFPFPPQGSYTSLSSILFLCLSHIGQIFCLLWVWIYCGVFATIEGSIAPHLSPLVPQSGYKGQIWQICWKITKEVRSSGRSENGGVLLPRSEEHLSLKRWILRKWP